MNIEKKNNDKQNARDIILFLLNVSYRLSYVNRRKPINFAAYLVRFFPVKKIFKRFTTGASNAIEMQNDMR